jgi:hypothetical protein
MDKLKRQKKINRMLKGIKSSYQIYETYGKVISISVGMVLMVVAFATPLTNLFLLPLAAKYRNKELFKISIRGD